MDSRKFTLSEVHINLARLTHYFSEIPFPIRCASSPPITFFWPCSHLCHNAVTSNQSVNQLINQSLNIYTVPDVTRKSRVINSRVKVVLGKHNDALIHKLCPCAHILITLALISHICYLHRVKSI